jgi:general secretion pathway protein F
MANFHYIARTSVGEQVRGVMQADSESAVLRTLSERQLYPVQVAPADERQAGAGHRRVKMAEVGMLFRQMSELLRAGVPMLRTLDTLVRSASKPGVLAVVRDLREQVSQGRSLADAMRDQPRIFTSLHGSMVHAGEEAGFLEDVLENLAGFIERQDELRSKVRGLLIYPCVLLGIGSVLMILILSLLVPKFKGFFPDMALPIPTRIIFAASDLLTQHAGLLVAMLFLLGVGLVAFARSEVGGTLRERLRLSLPLLGKLNRSVSVARFCRILGTMLHNGVPILRALDISKDATGSAILAGQIEHAAENVRAGEPLAEPFRDSGIFSPDVIEMIAVAEESNQMDTVLVRIADTVERRTNRQVDTVMRLIEPLILVVLAGTIGFVAVGLMYPMFLVSQQIR